MSLEGQRLTPVDGALPDTSLITGRQRIATSVDCAECSANFTGPGMWHAYAEHLRTEHPQQIPTPAQREAQEPVASHTESSTAVEPAPKVKRSDVLVECPDCGVTFSGKHALASHRRWKHPEDEGVSSTAEPVIESVEAPPAGTEAGEIPAALTADEAAPRRGGAVAAAPTGSTPDASVSPAASTVILALGEALNRYGWHLASCEAYWSGVSNFDAPACELDNAALACSCLFRAALALVVES